MPAAAVLMAALTACPECRAGLGGRVLALRAAGWLPDGPEFLFDMESIALAEQRIAAPGLVAEAVDLLGQALIATAPEIPARLLSRGLVERLCIDSEAAAACDLDRASSMARAAYVISARLIELAGTGRKAEFATLAAYSMATIANAARVRGDLDLAVADFADAWGFFAHAVPETKDIPEGLLDLDPHGYASRIMDMQASLAIDRHQHAEALRLLDKALALEREGGPASEWPLNGPPASWWGDEIGRVLVKKSRLLREAGDLLGSLSVLQEAAEEVDAGANPRLGLCIASHRYWNLLEFGGPGAAEEALSVLADLTKRHGGKLDRVRLSWARGRFAVEAGNVKAARAHLESAWRQFAAAGCGFDAALAALELAQAESRQGRHAAVRQIAASIVPLFQSRGIHREALAALGLFTTAAAGGMVAREFVGAVVAYLHAARHDPAKVFTPPASAPNSR